MQWRGVLAAGVVFLAACGGNREVRSDDQHEADTVALEGLLPAIVLGSVTVFRDGETCQALEYAKGCYASSDDRRCRAYVQAPPKPFARKSQEDFDEMRAAVAKLPLPVVMIHEVEFGTDGKVVRAVFDCSGEYIRQHYVYQPGYALPSDVPNTRWHRYVTPDWYYVKEGKD